MLEGSTITFLCMAMIPAPCVTFLNHRTARIIRKQAGILGKDRVTGGTSGKRGRGSPGHTVEQAIASRHGGLVHVVATPKRSGTRGRPVRG